MPVFQSFFTVLGNFFFLTLCNMTNAAPLAQGGAKASQSSCPLVGTSSISLASTFGESSLIPLCLLSQPNPPPSGWALAGAQKYPRHRRGYFSF